MVAHKETNLGTHPYFVNKKIQCLQFVIRVFERKHNKTYRCSPRKHNRSVKQVLDQHLRAKIQQNNTTHARFKISFKLIFNLDCHIIRYMHQVNFQTELESHYIELPL